MQKTREVGPDCRMAAAPVKRGKPGCDPECTKRQRVLAGDLRKGNPKAIGAIELILNRHNDTENHDEECELGYWLENLSGEEAICRRQQEK